LIEGVLLSQVFINSIFGYLCILILTKWTTNWDATFVLNNDQVNTPPHTSPPRIPLTAPTRAPAAITFPISVFPKGVRSLKG